MQDSERKSPDRYLKWAHAFVVVYSITSRTSYDEARSYLDTIAQYQRITGKDIPVAVVGNKMDLERYRYTIVSYCAFNSDVKRGQNLEAEAEANF